MSKLNGEVLYLILKELNKIEKPLYTYLLINKSWCEIIISTLWKNPWKYTNFYHEEKLLLEVIILHLSNETRNKLVMLGFDFSLFNNISFCKHLDLIAIEHTNSMAGAKIYEIDFFMNEIIRLFVNDENTNITHLYIPNCQIHLIPEAKQLASDFYNEKWHCLENLSTHFLQILRARRVSIKPLARLIENTSGYLTEFTINNEGDNTLNNRIIIQAICKNLKYLKLSLRSANILELEKLLINCQYLEGLYILKIDAIDWGNLFEILAKSSPNRHPMLLHFIQILQFGLEHKNLIEKYKEEGIVKFSPTIFLMKILMGLKEKYNYLYMLNFFPY
uniref:Uncharacterized protein n=1 Tax=Rhizophagus irregularis (strain DAOM 181602 / DAOM 197198 / MUCL 43194) TaxID=747089 RepID=U9TZP7_RHIID